MNNEFGLHSVKHDGRTEFLSASVIPAKPLTPEEREEIQDSLETYDPEHKHCDGMLKNAMDAEAFWREAVKSENPISIQTTWQTGLERDRFKCNRCKAVSADPESIEHASDCLWKLAQD